MSKFKVGDRIAVYCAGRGLFGAKATVGEILSEGRLAARLDSATELADTQGLHEKQCRLLKPKKRRGWVLAIDSDGDVHDVYHVMPELIRSDREYVPVREVRK